jgi:hypothetical protein
MSVIASERSERSNLFLLRIGIATSAFGLLAMTAWAGGAGSVTGMTLLHDSGARSTALGGAFTSMTDDITAMDFNPASLSTLNSGQLSLDYERGFFDDTFSKAMVGVPGILNGTMGVSLGYYNSGKTTLYDGVDPERSVVAQQDMLASAGYGFKLSSFDVGTSVKYLKSELAQTSQASAVSADVGLQYQFAHGIRAGVSGPIAQSNLHYADTNENLPKVYRAGVGWDFKIPLASGAVPLHLLFDVPYDANARVAAYAAGAETHVGIMALRLGASTQSDIQQFSMGAGFEFHRMSLDYSFGLVNNGTFDAVHKINFSLRFDGLNAHSSKDLAYGVYEMKNGDTLESIALQRYGSADRWPEIYAKNRQQYSSPEEIRPGSKILLPL